MKKRQFKRHVVLLAITLVALIMLAGARPPASRDTGVAAAGPLNNEIEYSVTDFGLMMPLGINNLGQVAGYSFDDSGQALLWDSGEFINLGPGRAFDVNDAGQVVGDLHSGNTGEAFIWQDLNGNGQMDPGEMQMLGTLGGSSSTATAINNLGQVVGMFLTGQSGEIRPFLWQSGVMSDLGTLGGPMSLATDINEQGRIVGSSMLTDVIGDWRPFLWQNGSMSQLDDRRGQAGGINNSGQVTGYFITEIAPGQFAQRQFLWLPEPAYGLPGGMNNLGFVGNSPTSSAINDLGQVVGNKMLWHNDIATEIIDLFPPDSGWAVYYGTGINNRGQIIGWGNYNGESRGFLLSPLPKWTLLFYLAGDNDLSNSYWHVFNQLERAADNPDVQVVAAWDGRTHQMNYYHVQHDTDPNKLADYVLGETWWNQGEPDMGDPTTLSDFLLWAMEKFPSEHYALILDDHGQGLGTFLVDWTNDGEMNLEELQMALETVYSETGRKFDVLYMAMCLMGLIEDAYQVRDYADYYVAIQDIQWAYSSPYFDYVAGITAESTPAEVAVNFAAAYHNAAVAANNRYTISVADMAQLEGLVTAVDNLAVELQTEMATITGTLQTISLMVQRFDMNADNVIDNQDSYADLYDFAWLVSQNLGGHPAIVQAAQAVMTAIDQYIIYERHASKPNYNLDNSHGVGIFLPTQASSFYRGSNYDFAQGTEWPWLPPEEGRGTMDDGRWLADVQGPETIHWGPMLVEFFQLTQPDGPDNPDPPPPISKKLPETSLYLPLIVK